MSGFALKCLALALMSIDHVGAIIFPQVRILRLVGRLSFPIFSFLIAEGYAHTSSFRRYLSRLCLFALLSEIPFDLAFHGRAFDVSAQNIFFTLALGLAAIELVERFRQERPWLSLLCAAVLFALSELFHCDYGWFGVALTVCFYLLRESRVLALITFCLLDVARSLPARVTQLYAVGAALPLALYNGRRGRYSIKGFFYAFYPLHLLLLWGIRLLL